MTSRVRAIAERLTTVLPVLSDGVRADIEELIALAERAERDAPLAPQHPARAERHTAQREPVGLATLLASALAEHGAPMRVRDLVQAAVTRGWTTASDEPGKVVSACLSSRNEFVAVARGTYALASSAASAPKVPSAPAKHLPEADGVARPTSEHGSVEAAERDAPRETPSAEAPLATVRGGVLGADDTTRRQAEHSGGSSLRMLIRDLLAHRGSPMRAAEIADALVAAGWTTSSSSPRGVVSAVLSANGEFVAVERGLYALAPRDVRPQPSVSQPVERAQLRAANEGGPGEPHATSPREQGVARATAPNEGEPFDARPHLVHRVDGHAGANDERVPAQSAERVTSSQPAPTTVAEVAEELEFLLQHVADARADTAVLAPSLLRLQITAWIAHARALNDRARGHAAITRATGRVASELGELCKRWWPGSVDALKLDARPASVLHAFLDVTGVDTTWHDVALALDAKLATVWAEPGFDDGWKDTRWVCEDARYAEERLRNAEEVLASIGTPVGEPPLRRGADLQLSQDGVHRLIGATKGLRWVRSVATDGTRWGALAGRMRWIAANHPSAARSLLPQVLDADHQPLSGWGFEEVLRAERKAQLTAELAALPADGLGAWLTRAIDTFDNPELARILDDRRAAIAAIDPGSLGSRRVRGRIRKLAALVGVAVAEPTLSEGPGESVAPDPERATPPAETFASIRAALLDRVGGNRALFISNREDAFLRDKLSSTFGLDLEWCVAHPRRADSAADAIRRGRYHVILSATGFQDHTMDAAFSRAAKDASTLYVRVNRGRPAACARAIARELGFRGSA